MGRERCAAGRHSDTASVEITGHAPPKQIPIQNPFPSYASPAGGEINEGADPVRLLSRRHCALWPALATTECEPWRHRRLSTGGGRTHGTFVGCQGDHHAVTLREMQRMPRGGAWHAKSASNLLVRA